MFKQKCDDFLVYDEATNSYSMPQDQQVRDTVEKNKWKNVVFTVLKDWRLYLMLVPMIVVYVLWRYMPMYELLGCFKNPTTSATNTVSEELWVGLRYFYQIMFAGDDYSMQFWRAFRNTFATAFYGLLFGFPVPIILALFFNEVRSNVARNIMQVCVYLPKFLSTVIVTSLALVLFKSGTSTDGEATYGVVSRLLVWFGVDESLACNGLIYTTQYYRGLYVVLELWEHAGYDSIVFFAAVIAVSPTSYEAAQIDGAGKMAQMRYVVIPSILSTVVIMLIMKIGSLLSVGYEKIYLLLGEGPQGGSNYEAADTVSTWANRMQSVGGDKAAYGKAAEMMNNLIGMLLVIGSNAVARRATDVSLY